MSTLLKKYEESLKDKESSVEVVPATLMEAFVYKQGSTEDGTTWRKVGLKTNKGTFFAFESAVSGIGVQDYIPSAGYSCKLSLRERTYKDEDDKDQTILECIGCKVITVSEELHAEISAIRNSGLMVNLFSR